MKTCGKCGIEKPFTEFHLRTGKGHQAWCKPCRKAYDREYFAQNQTKRTEQAKAHRHRLLELNWLIKAASPCADCGQMFHPAAMQWDHLPGTQKVDEISDLVRDGKTRAFSAELEKCELVCANCHAVRSYERRLGA